MSLRALQGPTGGGAPVGGTGTTNYIPRWNPGPSTLGDSGLIDNGTAIYTTTRNVGIGTASPNAILSVYNAGTPTISLWNSSNYSRLATNTNDLYIDAGLGGAAGAVIFRRGSGTVDSARIDSSGNVGIGETSPASYGRLAVTGSAVGAGILGMNTDATRVDIQSYNKPLAINRAGNNTLMNEGGGNVGIGTASPGAILHTLGTGTTTGIFATSSANAWMELRRSTSTTLGYIGTGSGLVTGGAAADLAFRCESGNLLFSTVATERARIDSAGNLILNTANTGATIQAAGTSQGLKLPATPGNGNANTLDSYQEGTRVLSAGDLSGWTYVTATQYWTLVGRTVTLHTVFTGGTSSATGGATIATPPLLTPLRIAAGAAVNSSGTALGNGVCVVASTSSTTGTVITSNAISSSAVDKVITVTYETAGL